MLYLRVRKGFGDDYGRIDHQKQALAQLAAKLRSPRGLAALPTILGGIGNGVETNADPELLTALRPYLSNLKLSFATLPTDTIRGSFNLAVNREQLDRLWGDQPLPASPTPNVKVSVVDASGAGLGAAAQRALNTLGYGRVTVRQCPKAARPVRSSPIRTWPTPTRWPNCWACRACRVSVSRLRWARLVSCWV